MADKGFARTIAEIHEKKKQKKRRGINYEDWKEFEELLAIANKLNLEAMHKYLNLEWSQRSARGEL